MDAGVLAQLGWLISAWRGTLRGLSFLYIDLEVFLEPLAAKMTDIKLPDRREISRLRLAEHN